MRQVTDHEIQRADALIVVYCALCAVATAMTVFLAVFGDELNAIF